MKNKERNMALDGGRMKGFSMLVVFVGVIIAVASVIVIVAALVIYVISVISLKFFGAGGIEVIGAFNTPYVVANTLVNAQVDGRPLLEPVLVASVTKLDAATMSKVSTAIKNLLDSYDFPYVVKLDIADAAPAACNKLFDSSHKAVDITVNCGAPVKAVCNGRLSTIGPGLSDDKVFGGTSGGGQQGLEVEHDKSCDYKPDYRSLYGCVEIPDRKSRDVKKGETIGFVGTCGAEPGDCHLHFVVTKTKGAIKDAEDPHICDKIDRVLEQGTNVLARKGEFDELSFTASVPLMFKDKLRKLVVTIGEG